MDISKLELYCDFLNLINVKIGKFFDSQKPYIFCKEGCSNCCQSGEYPCSQLEFEYMVMGFYALDNEVKNIIKSKINTLMEQKKEFVGENFLYECPFLINDKCSVYNFRPIICRTHGLPYYEDDEQKKIKVPFCVYDGLNYSQVYDPEKGITSQEMFEKTGFNEKPIAFNLSQKFLKLNVGNEAMGLDFGKEMAIINWIEKI